MSKPVIAVDIDDVLAAENEAMRVFINEVYGQRHSKEDYNIAAPYFSYWEKIWKVDADEGHQRYMTFIGSPAKANLQVVEGATEVIRKLKEKFRLVVVTSRGDDFADMTHEWLEKHFPKTFQQVEFVTVWSKDKEASKAMICKQIGADYLVDDNVEHCNLAAEAGLKALLFGDYGWNRHERLHPSVVRVKNWQEVSRYFAL